MGPRESFGSMGALRSLAEFGSRASRASQASLAAVRSLARRAGSDALDALLPQQCGACARALAGSGVLCPRCTEAIPTLSVGVCARCLAGGGEPVGCLAHPDYTVWPAWIYDPRAELVVHALKFGGRQVIARELGPVLARAAGHLASADLVSEIPLHRARQRERGYNQAALLAEALSRTLGVPRLPGLLERSRATLAQARLGGLARRDNLRGAFQLTRPEWVRGRRIIVVDDVITSGATLEAAMTAFQEVGAHPVAVTLAWAQ